MSEKRKQVRAVSKRMVRYIVLELAIHGLIADSGEAERQAAVCIKNGIETAEYDAVHGDGAHFRKYLAEAKAVVDSWPAWKRGE